MDISSFVVSLTSVPTIRNKLVASRHECRGYCFERHEYVLLQHQLLPWHALIGLAESKVV